MIGFGSRLTRLLRRALVFLIVVLTSTACVLVLLDNCEMSAVRQEWRVGRTVGNSQRADKTKREGECCDVSFHCA